MNKKTKSLKSWIGARGLGTWKNNE
jgi:hypothetical protein